jgi:hypothetical protein
LTNGRPHNVVRKEFAPCPTTLGENGSQDAKAIAERTEIAGPVNPRMLEARNLGNNEPGLGCSNMN